jgi:hypothetical protein
MVETVAQDMMEVVEVVELVVMEVQVAPVLIH